ncbi:MAG: hypothetical protein EP330_28575 [Deltaproteobacteria bacterium]|nr:MAG: hypothetical protein EP330_28575 [Deltaproteobacteria bacterium]
MLALLVSLAMAQDVDPEWTVTVDPLTFGLGYAHVQVERAVSERASVYVGPHMRLFDGLLTEGHEPFLGFGAEVGVRYFPWGEAPEGAWIMGRQVVARLHTTDGSAPAKPGGYSSVLVGYTGILGERFVLSGGAGLNVLYYDIGEYGVSGPFPALHTNLGVAF